MGVKSSEPLINNGETTAKKKSSLINRDIFTNLTEARVLIKEWRREYNQVRPDSALGYKPPAPEATIPVTLT